MELRLVNTARLPDRAQGLPLENVITLRDVNLVEMGINRNDPTRMANKHDIAKVAKLVARIGNLTRL